MRGWGGVDTATVEFSFLPFFFSLSLFLSLPDSTSGPTGRVRENDCTVYSRYRTHVRFGSTSESISLHPHARDPRVLSPRTSGRLRHVCTREVHRPRHCHRRRTRTHAHHVTDVHHHYRNRVSIKSLAIDCVQLALVYFPVRNACRIVSLSANVYTYIRFFFSLSLNTRRCDFLVIVLISVLIFLRGLRWYLRKFHTTFLRAKYT